MRFGASIMCADQMDLKGELQALKEAGIGWIHCDVMDGVFVNNLAMGPYNTAPIIQDGGFIIDVHLATYTPERFVELFAPVKPHYLTFHVEAADRPRDIIRQIQGHGIQVGIAISPETELETILDYLPEVDLVLVMTVNPGFAGQRMQLPVLEKLRGLQAHMAGWQKRPLISVDGNIHGETIALISPIGADVYILGTSGLFFGEKAYREKVKRLADML